MKASDRQSHACHLIHSGFLLGLFFDSEDRGDIPPKRWSTFNHCYDNANRTQLFSE
jgi:hypothetical protein